MNHAVFVETANHVKLLEAMTILQDAAQGMPGLGLVWGRAGRGKTESCRTYAVRSGAKYLRVMEGWSPAAMCRALAALLVPAAEPRTIEQSKRLILAALDARRAVVILDEADRLRHISLIEHLRDIHDITGAPVVLVGEEDLFGMINARRRIWSRVTQCVEFGPITPEDVTVFGGKAAGLDVADVAHILCERAGGDFRLVCRDMLALERLGKASGVQTITPAMIAALPSLQPSGGLHGRA